MADPKLNLIQIQERYINRVNDARRRWAHRRDGGHSGRTGVAARREAEVALAKWGIKGKVARQIVWDANDAAELQYLLDAAGEES
jgi:hypothetical protein